MPESGEDESEATGHGEARGEVRWAPGDAVSALDMVGWPVVSRRHVGDELRGGACGELRVLAVVHESEKEKGRR